uniref:Uncharacterized protein n=1 Tax=Ackermannviridae sp. TaxID=2831612 RepID=A0A8S5VXP1_9CAUD|nr:MAG TPA: hypothetical protein [Ackermannviridae sp.]
MSKSASIKNEIHFFNNLCTRGLPRLLVLHTGLAPLPRRSLRNAAPLLY